MTTEDRSHEAGRGAASILQATLGGEAGSFHRVVHDRPWHIFTVDVSAASYRLWVSEGALGGLSLAPTILDRLRAAAHQTPRQKLVIDTDGVRPEPVTPL